jgi:predicted HAD superfamily Cof-like phosphohydrolase
MKKLTSKDYYGLVDIFSKTFHVLTDQKYNLDQAILRRKLLTEENDEFWEGVQMVVHANESRNVEERKRQGFLEMFDALIDIKYVLVGAFVDFKGWQYKTTDKYTAIKKVELFDYNEIFNTYRQIEKCIEGLVNENEAIAYTNACMIDDYVNYLIANLGFKTIFSQGFMEVHESNMSKLEDGKVLKREDGKVLKGKDYFKPNLEQFLYPILNK